MNYILDGFLRVFQTKTCNGALAACKTLESAALDNFLS